MKQVEVVYKQILASKIERIDRLKTDLAMTKETAAELETEIKAKDERIEELEVCLKRTHTTLTSVFNTINSTPSRLFYSELVAIGLVLDAIESIVHPDVEDT